MSVTCQYPVPKSLKSAAVNVRVKEESLREYGVRRLELLAGELMGKTGF